MTRIEVAELFGLEEIFMHRVFRYAENDGNLISDGLKEKAGTSTVSKTVNYSLDEVLYVMDRWNQNPDYRSALFTPMAKQYLRENFKDHGGVPYVLKEKKSLVSSDAKRFIYYYKLTKGYHKTCASCGYISARTPNKAGCRPSPYCMLYDRFINKMKEKINIYVDRCPSFIRTDRKPLIFTKSGLQSIDGAINGTTLGIDNSEFTSEKTKRGEEPVLLTTVTYADED